MGIWKNISELAKKKSIILKTQEEQILKSD